jgi:hypothetical protein
MRDYLYRRPRGSYLFFRAFQGEMLLPAQQLVENLYCVLDGLGHAVTLIRYIVVIWILLNKVTDPQQVAGLQN